MDDGDQGQAWCVDMMCVCVCVCVCVQWMEAVYIWEDAVRNKGQSGWSTCGLTHIGGS